MGLAEMVVELTLKFGHPIAISMRILYIWHTSTGGFHHDPKGIHIGHGSWRPTLVYPPASSNMAMGNLRTKLVGLHSWEHHLSVHGGCDTLPYPAAEEGWVQVEFHGIFNGTPHMHPCKQHLA